LTRWLARSYQLTWDAKGTGCYLITDLGVSHNDLWHVPFADPQRDAQKLTSGIADEDWPSLARDGQLLVHTDNNAGATALVLMDFIHDERMRLSVNELEFDKAYREQIALLRLQ